MKLTNLGGATAILEHGGRRMLLDPWLDEGIMHGSWFHYPPLNVGIEDLGRFDYIYISHIHEDHCSPGTIRHLNRDAEIILIDREPNFVKRFLDMYGFEFKKIHFVKPYTPTRIADGITADIVDADPANEANYLIDSALVLDWDGFVLYDANDCPPYPGSIEYLQRAYPKIDLGLLYYAGGSSYPPCFVNLSHEEKLREKRRIYEAGIQSFVETVVALKPRYAMPFADQYVVGGSRWALNRYLPHPPDGGVIQAALAPTGLGDRALLLASGQSFDFDRRVLIPDVPFRASTEDEREEYLRTELADKPYDHEAFDLDRRVSLERLADHARARMWAVQTREGYTPSFRYYLDIPDRDLRLAVDLRVPGVAKMQKDAPLEQPYLRVSAPATLMALLLIGHVSWNIADAALFLDYDRAPNVYDPKLHSYLNHLRI